MEAIFFASRYDDALGVRSQDDLPADPIGDPLDIDSLGALRVLASALGSETEGALQQLTDTTCQSFPVWVVAPPVAAALRSLPDASIDEVAERWRSTAGGEAFDADLHELCELLVALRAALAEGGTREEQLFVLLEEKAL